MQGFCYITQRRRPEGPKSLCEVTKAEHGYLIRFIGHTIINYDNIFIIQFDSVMIRNILFIFDIILFYH